MKLLYSIQYSVLTSRFSLGLILSTVSLSAFATVTINYDDNSPSSILQTAPSWTTFVGNDSPRTSSLFPGTTTNPLSSNNTVTVNFVTNQIPNDVYGGLILNGSLTNNTINILNSKVNKNIYGSFIKAPDSDAVIKNSTVIIDNSIIGENIYSGIIQRNIFSGENDPPNITNNTTLSNNTVTVTNQSKVKNIYGAYSESGGSFRSINENNLIQINNSTVTGSVKSVQTYGDSQTHTILKGNSITITDSTVKEYITAAHGEGMTVTSSDNSIKINGNSTIGEGNWYTVIASEITASPDENSTVTSTNNTIEINGDTGNGVTINSKIYGSYDSSNADNSTATNRGNQIIISGKTAITNDIYGGYAYANTASSTMNSVKLNGTGITIGGSIYGGYAIDINGEVTDPTKVRQGNILDLNGYRGTVGGINNFETYNWTLPSDIVNGDRLVQTGTAINLDGTNHNIYMIADGNELMGGDTVTLIDKTSGSFTTQNYIINQGQFIIYDATLAQTNDSDHPFILTINDATNSNPPTPTPTPTPPTPTPPTPPENKPSAAKLNPQSKSYVEGRIASLALVNQAGELISTAGIDHIRTLINHKEEINSPTLVPFFITNGASERYKTGSHIDMNSYNLATGLAIGKESISGNKLTLGAFFEYGKGHYHTYNNFTQFTSIRGNGRSYYSGGGLFGRIEFANTGLDKIDNLPADQSDGLYSEASLRIGRTNNKFNVGSVQITDKLNSNYRGSYHSKSTYYGGHLAGGYLFNFDQMQSLDTYLRYLWTHINQDTVNITKESLHFDNTNSSRLQIGGRYTYSYSDQFRPFLGAIYEYEFDGEAKASAHKFNLDKPTLEGSSGIVEIGFHSLPIADNSLFSLDVSAQGYVGKRQGGSGNIKIKYQF